MLDFSPRVVAASLSGESDADWAKAAAPYVGAAMLGGIAIDAKTQAGARKLLERDRSEFLPDDPIAFIDEQLTQLADTPLTPGVNVRSTTPEPIEAVAAICRDHDAIVEINAHCRQDELCAVGAGETLLADTERLRAFVECAAQTGATVSVKARAELPAVDLKATAKAVYAAGGELFHLDAMDSPDAIERVATATPLAVIANNGVRDRRSVRTYFELGADAVSVGRPSDSPAVLSRVKNATTEWVGTEGSRKR
ncbi:tRNA-dihydrouridine synthase [Halocatena halophila]|uniref:tRNA-dihydrouridine synthase n=1 Tax=Halocatena halophila TaxID=2814576 RepID=UPI002ED5891B